MQQAELLGTGTAEIRGAPSTWRWAHYNGRIQQHIRSLLAAGADLQTVQPPSLAMLDQLV